VVAAALLSSPLVTKDARGWTLGANEDKWRKQATKTGYVDAKVDTKSDAAKTATADAKSDAKTPTADAEVGGTGEQQQQSTSPDAPPKISDDRKQTATPKTQTQDNGKLLYGQPPRPDSLPVPTGAADGSTAAADSKTSAPSTASTAVSSWWSKVQLPSVKATGTAAPATSQSKTDAAGTRRRPMPITADVTWSSVTKAM
jgi:hypothetical protein